MNGNFRKQNIMNNCIKEKKFLWWKWKVVEHNYKPKRISKFMTSSNTYHLDYECECGAEFIKKFVTQDSLILMGIDINKLKPLDYDRFEIIDFEKVQVSEGE